MMKKAMLYWRQSEESFGICGIFDKKRNKQLSSKSWYERQFTPGNKRHVRNYWKVDILTRAVVYGAIEEGFIHACD